eukprot:CAMPEP_0116867666 /NCGR_PEP_ID=MMETSP0418-20121206/26748_1 /TAXON_ID=1158023 /ORGANISM="Astrosyne radiata, Strain 13vi08-1A" /LENGTH=212 /DNA_ID=CAMNT_0004503511 /DNA_START=222 /DNA_END=860 /DNA_ORIENTATION=+
MALCFCWIGRLLNIFPLSCLANQCRRKGRGNRITCKMQWVLWFAGLRGAIAFALSENMPGPNKETYTTATLAICIFTTLFCGSLTDHVLTRAGMKTGSADLMQEEDDDIVEPFGLAYYNNNSTTEEPPIARRVSGRVYAGVKGIWKKIDNRYLKVYFGGSQEVQTPGAGGSSGGGGGGAGENDNLERGNYELTNRREEDVEEDDDDDDMEDL